MEKSAGSIVFYIEKNEPLFLLLKYGYGHWSFSKGHIEKGENEIEAMLRELSEETGIDRTKVRIIEGFKEKISYFYKKEGRTIYKTVIYFLVESKTKDVKLSFEHRDFVWLNYERALNRLTFRTDKEVLKKAFMFLKERFKI